MVQLNDCYEKVIKESNRLDESIKRKDRKRRSLEERERQRTPHWHMGIDEYLEAQEEQQELRKQIERLKIKLYMEKQQYDMLQDIIRNTKLWEEELDGKN